MSNPSDWTIQAVGSDGTVDIDSLAKILLVTRADVAVSTGLSPMSGPRTPQQPLGKLQGRLSLVRILERAGPWAGHPRIAFAWYRSQPLPSFGDMTAEDLLKMNRAAAVEGYLDRVAAGGYT